MTSRTSCGAAVPAEAGSATGYVEERGPGASGFTLLEMMIVLVVLGLAAGLVIARGPPHSPALEARAAASDIAQSLRLARARAISGNRPITFALDIVDHSFRLDDGAPRFVPASLGLTATVVARETALGRRFAILFEPDGSSSGGRIGIVAGTRHLSVDVDWLTGRVHVAEAG